MADDFEYGADQRLDILTKIEVGDEDALFRRLTESARFALTLRRRERGTPYASEFRRDIDRLARAYDSMSQEAKDAVCRAGVQDMARALEVARWRDDGIAPHVPERGRRPNDAAFVFASHCAHIWADLTGRKPPRRAHPGSPFMRFVEAALPAGLKDDSHGAMTGQVRETLKHFHRPTPWDS